jgi:hypothetical protein
MHSQRMGGRGHAQLGVGLQEALIAFAQLGEIGIAEKDQPAPPGLQQMLGRQLAA